jgi:hypothetical protein
MKKKGWIIDNFYVLSVKIIIQSSSSFGYGISMQQKKIHHRTVVLVGWSNYIHNVFDVFLHIFYISIFYRYLIKSYMEITTKKTTTGCTSILYYTVLW